MEEPMMDKIQVEALAQRVRERFSAHLAVEVMRNGEKTYGVLLSYVDMEREEDSKLVCVAFQNDHDFDALTAYAAYRNISVPFNYTYEMVLNYRRLIYYSIGGLSACKREIAYEIFFSCAPLA